MPYLHKRLSGISSFVPHWCTISFSSKEDQRNAVSYLQCRSRKTFLYQWRSGIFTMQHKNPESYKRCFHCISDYHSDVKLSLMNTWQPNLSKEWFDFDMNAFNCCLLNDIPLKQPAKGYSDTVNQGFAALRTRLKPASVLRAIRYWI